MVLHSRNKRDRGSQAYGAPTTRAAATIPHRIDTGSPAPVRPQVCRRMNTGARMDAIGVMTRFESAVSHQAALASGDPAVETATEVLLRALRPALHQLVANLAEQAAAEVAAQLPGHRVDVLLVDGEPTIGVRPDEGTTEAIEGGAEARLTLRLPASLKVRIDDAARAEGDSVNSYVVKALAATTSRRTRSSGRRLKGTMHT